MQTEAFTRLEENSSSPRFWALADIKAALNEGLEEMSDSSEWYERNYAIPHVAAQVYTDLKASLGSDQILTPKHAFNNQTNRWIEFKDVRDLDNERLEWETVTGEEEKCILRGLWWLGTFPHPAASSGSLTLYFTALPPTMVSDSDTPGFPDEYHYGIVEYALGDLFSQERDYVKSLSHFKAFLPYDAGLKHYVESRIARDRIHYFRG